MTPILLKSLRSGIVSEPAPEAPEEWRVRSAQASDAIRAILGRALVIRAVGAGSSNGCELEVNALSNPYYILEGLGMRLAASPRHADLLLVTGPVAKSMEEPLRIAYAAMPEPKLVVALGDCARDGGIFGASYATCGGVSKMIPVDVTVPGCPPPPIAILEGILAAVRGQGA